MKRVLLTICSIVLVLACVFGLFACVAGLKDIMNINDYKNSDAETAREGIAAARDGIAQLQENEQVYIDGVGTYTSGLAEYAAGQAQLADGKAQLEAGEKALAEGQAQIDANTEAYNEGKALIEKMESFMPLIEGIADAAQNVRDFNAGIPIVGATADSLLGTLRANVLNLLADSAAVSAISDMVGTDIGSLLASNPTDTSICGNVVAMYYDGLAQLKQYEDGLVALEEGKKTLEEGYATYEDGKAQLAAGAVQLAEGDAQLSVFEEGEVQLADGMMQLLEAMVPCYRQNSYTQTVNSLPEYLAEEWGLDVEANFLSEEGFDEAAYMAYATEIYNELYQHDEDGELVTLRGNNMLDLDRCLDLCDAGEQYLADQEADIKGEVYVRIGMYAAVAIACILGIIAGIVGLIGGITGSKKTGKGCGVVCAVLAVAALVVGIFTHFGDYIYATRVDAAGEYAVELANMDHYVYSGNMQHTAIIVLAIVAVIFVIVASMAKKAAVAKEQKAAVEAASNEAAAAGAAAAAAAVAADDDRVSKLEAENAALRDMVANMSAEAATVKE